MAAKRLTNEEIDARLVAYNEAIEHISDYGSFETVTEREQADILAKSLCAQRDQFIKKYADRA